MNEKPIYFLSYVFSLESLDLIRQIFFPSILPHLKGIEMHISDFIKIQYYDSLRTSKNCNLNCSITNTPVSETGREKDQNSIRHLSVRHRVKTEKPVQYNPSW